MKSIMARFSGQNRLQQQVSLWVSTTWGQCDGFKVLDIADLFYLLCVLDRSL